MKMDMAQSVILLYFQFSDVGSVGGSTLRGNWDLALNGDMFSEPV
jgi:hypothetical protein